MLRMSQIETASQLAADRASIEARSESSELPHPKPTLREADRRLHSSFHASTERLTRAHARNVVLHYFACTMKTNITLRLDADLLRQIRVLAAEEGTSVSALLAVRLQQMLQERKRYERARRRSLLRLKEGMDLRWSGPASRDELHER